MRAAARKHTRSRITVSAPRPPRLRVQVEDEDMQDYMDSYGLRQEQVLLSKRLMSDPETTVAPATTLAPRC